MCGIAGWIDWQTNLKERQSVLETMGETLKYRGPDASGIWTSESAGMVHRRLIVVDPENGKQPMIRQRGQETYVITYNGELYNTPEIRDALKARGYTFEGHSDTEVLLLSYMEWKEKCVDYLNGIYAFGIWNEDEQSLFMARDRMGVKPLFFTQRGSSLIFGSELKTILAHPDVQPEIDAEGVAEVFLLGPSRTPGHGVLRNIKELRPGEYMVYNRNGLRINKYWSLESHDHEDDWDTTVKKVRELLLDAIEKQLVSDVPLCTFLSGGLDSGAITAVATEIYKKNGMAPLGSYSIDYVDNDKYFRPSVFQPNSDASWIKKVSDFLGTTHHNIVIDTPQLVEALKRAVTARDLPGMADVDSSLYLFSCEVKKDATVALSGECADEIFGGYPWFYREELLNSDVFPWMRSTNERLGILMPGILGNMNGAEYVRQRYQDTLAEVPALPGEATQEHRRREMMYLNLKWFMTTLLDRKDRMSMATGLEVRVPFCDHRIVEYVWNIPWEMKFYKEREKGLVREALTGILPDDVLWRKKSPYPKTHNPNYMKAVKNWLQQILDDTSSPLLQLINKQRVQEIVDSEGAAFGVPWFGQLMTGPQLMAYLIQADVWMKKYKVKLI
ncbi:asparagine synthase (glutamine-hydrolyzing) [Petroclostridium sp. X23]|uniref:asparagine synthase (glutamine-hydrolyzing) n=1 Tax=Petroclostridium sp. X23 TaxID=3045146 RepID=UPI0024AC84B7|nr:asparagine synthase (glutamine-hydrolyzing) [Petroclostridium sp. X23]WHH57115.1 asparagine synthase (glutamine-hydrolyzing) [Petroclostridium sp. X23]